MYIHRNYYTICVMSFCNHCKNQISSSLYLRFFGAIQIMHKLRKKNFLNHKIIKNHIFSNFSCMFLNPNNFFPIWIVIILIYYIWETSRNKLKKHSVTKNCSELSLFEQIVPVISKFLQILGLQPRTSKVFLDR